MKKFAVISGFLGSGKTTTMMALTEGSTVNAMISNDLCGEGLADNTFAQLKQCNASELTGTCICYQTENLVERLNSLFAAGAELVMSDIPGFGVGALDHVYHTLNNKYPGQFDLAPFTVLVEQETIRRLQDEPDADLAYILNTQLREADLIVLNKADLLSPDERTAAIAFLQERYPQAELIVISALRGEGLAELRAALMNGTASLQQPDIGYGGEAFSKIMGDISEYNIQYYTRVCCNTFDGNAYLRDIAEQVREGVRAVGGEIPHLKLLAWEPEGDYAKMDLIGVERPLETVKAFDAPVAELSVTLNSSAICDADELDRIVSGAVRAAGEAHTLIDTVIKKEYHGKRGQR